LSLVFAKPPQDLPAILRLAAPLTADAHVPVPLGLVRDVSIRWERCGEPVSLRRERSTGEEALVDPMQGAVNLSRRRLAAFLRESMASGWPVLVAQQSGT